MRVMQIVSSITNSGMSQSQKLYACWKYVVYGGFYYGGPDPNIYQSGWARSEALRMFRTGYGNCYGFSCIFAALAREIGYTPYMICGRVPGSRDGAADGFTRHCWVKINGLYYDPEHSMPVDDGFMVMIITRSVTRSRELLTFVNSNVPIS